MPTHPDAASGSPASREEVVRQVQAVLADVLDLDAPPPLEARLIEDLGAQSVDVISLLFEVEDRLGRHIADEDVAGLRTVGDVVEQVMAIARPGSGPASGSSGATGTGSPA